MTAPEFDFSARAAPIVQMGRSERRDTGNRWGEGMWGSGLWGVKDWEVVWADLICEVHQIDVDAGRGGATDRFVPGTATITASNVNQISDMIFPPVEDPQGFPFGLELVPQPPVTGEETLQAPDAATVVSNGWSFTDDFETVPPRWTFPSAWADPGTFPTVPMVWGAGYVAPEMYGNATTSGDTTVQYEAHGVWQWTDAYEPDENLTVALVVAPFTWPSAPVSGTPRFTVDVYYGMNRTDRAANCARFTFTPNFAGPNTVTVDILRTAADGSTVTGSTSPTFTTTVGADGAFPTLTLGAVFSRSSSESGVPSNTIRASVNGHATAYGIATWATGARIGFAVHYVQGDLGGADRPDAPHITAFVGPEFDDDFSRPTGSGWKPMPKYRALGPMMVEGGAMRAPVRYEGNANGIYYADGSAQWVSEFDGDQVIEIEVTGVSMPELYTISETILELHVKGNRNDLTSVTAIIYYLPGFGGGRIDWVIVRYGPNGEYDDIPAGGSMTMADWGTYPEPATWRLEADTAGDARLYYQGGLLGTATFANMPEGGRIGLKYHWGAGGPVALGTPRPTAPRIERAAGGLREPLGTEELGMWVRIGVDHQTLGTHWLLRGFVNGLVPTYVPDRDDAVRIECIDSLGEAGRVEIDGDQLSHPFLAAPGRIRQILDAASWPKHFRTLFDDATLMSRPASGKALDALTAVAESCGGAVYGDPVTGDVVFKGQDWQGPAAADEPQAWITNYRPDFEPGVPRVCPSGWEMSSQRQDMNTRVKFSTVTSDTVDGDPVVREWRWPAAERLYGVEKYERTLLCIDGRQVNELAFRQLRLRNPNQFPRVEAVQLDASTEDECLDLMTTATFTTPSKYHCQLRRDDGFVFNRNYLVTGVSHTMTRERWTCRLTLDPSHVFYAPGVRWGETGVAVDGVGRWGVGEWGRAR